MFVLFRSGDEIRAVHVTAPEDPSTILTYRGRAYIRAGHFELQHHLINAKNELTGFLLEDAGASGPIISQASFSKAANCQWDGYALAVLLTKDASPADSDGASVIGQRIYYDGSSDIILCIENTWDEPSNLRYEQLGFELATGNAPEVTHA